MNCATLKSTQYIKNTNSMHKGLATLRLITYTNTNIMSVTTKVNIWRILLCELVE